MIYQGLSNDYYLVDNPIYLTFNGTISIPNIENYLLTVTIGTYVFDVQMHNGLAIVDISPIVKHLMGVPNYFDQSNIITLSAEATYFTDEQGVTDTIFEDIRFVRGSRYTGTNNNLENGDILKVTETIPVWSNYPTRKYTISGDNILEQVPTNGEIENMSKRSCNGIYIKFLNSLGGYTDYLFENFSIRKIGEQGNVIKNYDRDTTFPGRIDYHNNFTQLSANGEYEITAEGRIDQRYYNIIRDLVHSSEVLVYDFDKLIGSDFGYATQRWTKLINPGNSISINSEDETTDVALNFNTMLTKNNRVNA